MWLFSYCRLRKKTVKGVLILESKQSSFFPSSKLSTDSQKTFVSKQSIGSTDLVHGARLFDGGPKTQRI